MRYNVNTTMQLPWQQWWNLADESVKAADALESLGHIRSSVSRYYYAAYQAMTAVLLYSNIVPPATREAWNHEKTPDLVREQITPLMEARNKRNHMAARLEALYKSRIIADYIGSRQISSNLVETARKNSKYLMRIAREILPKR